MEINMSITQIEPLEPRRHMSSVHKHRSLPQYDHVVIVVEENTNYGDVLGPSSIPRALWPIITPQSQTDDPFIRWLAKHGATLANAHGITHPSLPNYMAMFSGSTQNVDGDTPPAQLITAPSLGGQLMAAGLSFKSYSEDLPMVGSTVLKHKEYARKHNPASCFADVPPEDNQPFSAFPHDFTQLPTVSMVVPNQLHDMHSSTIDRADTWLHTNMRAYARWARSHNSLLIVTWDEGAGGKNHIPMILYGAHVKRRQFKQHVDHYTVLRTVEAIYHLPALGAAAQSAPMRYALFDLLAT
jgi:acid phosphatase